MKVERPPAPEGKISYKDSFELCYMRHTYIRKVKYNPTEADMLPYMEIVKKIARNTYNVYKSILALVGFDIDDLINIGRIHLIGFLGLYTLDKVPEKYKEFVKVFKKKNKSKPNANDIQDKNKATLTTLMKQRMETVIRVCRQKARNIKGFTTDTLLFFYGPNKPPEDSKLLLIDHEKYGFRKLDMPSFRSIKKRQKIRSNSEPFKFAGSWYIAVPTESRRLTIVDFTCAGFDPYDNVHNKNPEELLFDKIDKEDFEKKRDIFMDHPDEKKGAILRNFIRRHKNNPKFSEEIGIAKKYLKNLEY